MNIREMCELTKKPGFKRKKEHLKKSEITTNFSSFRGIWREFFNSFILSKDKSENIIALKKIILIRVYYE